MGIYKAIKYLMLIFGAIALVMGIWLFITDQESLANPMMYMGYAVLALTILLVIIFVIKDIIGGNVKRTLLSLVLFAIIVGIGYAFASSNNVGLTMVDGNTLSEAASKWIGAGIITFYILVVVAILAMFLVGPIKKLTDK